MNKLPETTPKPTTVTIHWHYERWGYSEATWSQSGFNHNCNEYCYKARIVEVDE